MASAANPRASRRRLGTRGSPQHPVDALEQQARDALAVAERESLARPAAPDVSEVARNRGWQPVGTVEQQQRRLWSPRRERQGADAVGPAAAVDERDAGRAVAQPPAKPRL